MDVASLLGREELRGALLFSGRPLALFVTLPWLGWGLAGVALRIGLGVAAAWLLLPVAGSAGIAPAAADGWLLVLREVAIGVTMGLVASVPFAAAESAGRLGARLRSGVSLDEGGSATWGRVYEALAISVFLSAGGLVWVVDALARSYQGLPLSRGEWPARAGFLQVAVASAASLIEAAVVFSAPLLLAALLGQLLVGAWARLAVGTLEVGAALEATVRALLGGVLALLSMGAVAAALSAERYGWTGSLLRTLDALLGRAR